MPSALDGGAASAGPRRTRAAMVGAMLAMALAALDQTIVAPALAPIAAELGDFQLVAWIVSAYLLTSTCAAPLIGKLSDLHGRRLTMAACLVVFTASSALCALAPSMLWLILARALQGLGGGGLIALSEVVLADTFSPREQGRSAPYIAGVWAVASVIGPLLGGVLTEYFGWAAIFWINLPLGGLALLIIERALRGMPIAGKRAPLDVASVALLCGATVALLLVLSLGGKRLGWSAPELLALGGIALVLGGGFARRQARSAAPILPRRFMGDRVIRPVLAGTFVVYGCYLTMVVLSPIYFQVALGRPVTETGLLLIPLVFSTCVSATLAGRYTRRVGRCKRPMLVGLPAAIVAMALLAGFARTVPAEVAAVGLFVIGLGLGPIFPCGMVAAQNAAERRDLGAVLGALSFARALGGSVAIAATSALVLGLAAAALPETGGAGLEDLARQALTPAARAAVAGAFGVAFGALAGALCLGLALYGLVEDRALSGWTPAPASPGD
jgi:EmrB/QacA subfamily drug resistance transporter